MSNQLQKPFSDIIGEKGPIQKMLNKGKIERPYILYTKDIIVKENVVHLPIYMAMSL